MKSTSSSSRHPHPSRLQELRHFLKKISPAAKTLWAFLLIFFIINLITPSRKFSAQENRALAQRPPSLLSQAFGNDFSTYYSDQFFGRDALVRLNFTAQRMIGQRQFSDVYVGRDGYLIAEPKKPDSGKLKAALQAITDFSSSHPDLKTNMILVPDAASVIPDKLPANVPAGEEEEQIAGIYKSLPSAVAATDAGKALREASGQVYYRTDHHWTSNGAYAVFKSAAASLGIDTIVDYDVRNVSSTFQGTLASRSGDAHSYDSIQIYTPRKEVLYSVHYPDLKQKTRSMFMPDKLKEKDQYTVFLGGNHAVVEIATTAQTGKSLLILKDSYANSFVQFLVPYYDTIIMVDPRYYYENVDSVITNYKTSDLLYIYSADTLFEDTSLADTLNAAK